MQFGAIVKKYRFYRGMSQGQLADKAGLARATIVQLESCKRMAKCGMQLRHAISVMRTLGIPWTELENVEFSGLTTLAKEVVKVPKPPKASPVTAADEASVSEFALPAGNVRRTE